MHVSVNTSLPHTWLSYEQSNIVGLREEELYHDICGMQSTIFHLLARRESYEEQTIRLPATHNRV